MTVNDMRTAIVQFINNFDRDDVVRVLTECQVIHATNQIAATTGLLAKQRHDLANVIRQDFSEPPTLSEERRLESELEAASDDSK